MLLVIQASGAITIKVAGCSVALVCPIHPCESYEGVTIVQNQPDGYFVGAGYGFIVKHGWGGVRDPRMRTATLL